MLPFNFSVLFCIRKCLQICEPRSGLLWESVLRFAYLYSMSIGFRELNITNLYYLYKIPSMESRMFYIFYHFIGFHLIVGGIRYNPLTFIAITSSVNEFKRTIYVDNINRLFIVSVVHSPWSGQQNSITGGQECSTLFTFLEALLSPWTSIIIWMGRRVSWLKPTWFYSLRFYS